MGKKLSYRIISSFINILCKRILSAIHATALGDRIIFTNLKLHEIRKKYKLSSVNYISSM